MLVTNKKIWSVVEFIRKKGFNKDEIELIFAVANPEVICRTKRAYVRYLAEEREIYIDYDRALEVMSRPAFEECVSLLYAQERGHALKAVEKCLLQRATDPKDTQGVAAAKLIYQASGMLRDDKQAGAGSVEHQFVQLIRDIREGRADFGNDVVLPKNRYVIEDEEDEVLQLESREESPTIEADFEPQGEGGDADDSNDGDLLSRLLGARDEFDRGSSVGHRFGDGDTGGLDAEFDDDLEDEV